MSWDLDPPGSWAARPMTDQDRHQVAEFYAAGRSLREIADLLGIGTSTVRTILLYLRVPIRPAIRRPRAKAP